MSNTKNKKIEIVSTMIVPDNDIDRNKLIKKGFDYASLKKNHGRLSVPDKYICEYEIEIKTSGGVTGCGSSTETWILYNKINKKPVVKIINYQDGDYPGPLLIQWY